jgi:peptide/nickel transport system substrate-binding protein
MNRRDVIRILASAVALPALPAFAQSGNNQLRVLFSQIIPDINPYMNLQRTGLTVSHHVWDTLVHRNSSTYEHEPLLARSWEWISPTVLELKLRDDVIFHNGDKFSADDVVFTVNKVSHPDAKVSVPSNVRWMAGAEKVSDHVVRINLKYPLPAALDYLALAVPILPKAYMEAVGDAKFSQEPIGCGPYRLTRVEPGVAADMELFDGYYEGSAKGRPAIGRISLKFVTDAGTQLTELLSGNADWIWDVSNDQIENLARVPRFNVLRTPSMRIAYLRMDAAGVTGKDNPLTNIKVRQAIFHAIDRPTLARQLISPAAEVPRATCFPLQKGCNTDDAVDYPYDPDKARALLAEAGYPDGFSTKLVSFLSPNILAAIQGFLGKVGIKLEVEFLLAAAAIQKNAQGETPLYLASWGSYSVMDVSASLNKLFSGDPDDYARDEEILKYLTEAKGAIDDDERAALYSKVLNRAMEMAYIVPLYTSVMNYAFSADLEFQAQPDELPRFYEAKWK